MARSLRIPTEGETLAPFDRFHGGRTARGLTEARIVPIEVLARRLG